MSDRKKMQLGMNPSTASHRLVKDVLWSLIVKTEQHDCCKCGEPMARDTFSIEHLDPWLDSDDPVALYFDLENIGFSHLKCNVADARRKTAVCGTPSRYRGGCRCTDCSMANARQQAERYTPERRKEVYKRTGK